MAAFHAKKSTLSRRAGKIAPPPPFAQERLWKKFTAFSVLALAGCAAVLLSFFIWKINTALSRLSEIPLQQTASAHNSAVRGSRALTLLHAPKRAEAEKTEVLPAQESLASAQGNASGSSETHPAAGDLHFLHSGLLYSSLLTALAGGGICLLLIYFMLRDKRNSHIYNTLMQQTDASLENRVRHRTARLQAARQTAEKERVRAELLLQDSSHRIGNSLATVSSLLGLQSRSSHNIHVQQALLSARDRIQAISAAHRRLKLGQDMETANTREFLSAVVHDIENGLTAKQRRHITIHTHFEPQQLPARDVTTLGIILGELLTNAVKHAFPNGKTGRIDVFFGKFKGKTLRLIVEDNGIGLPAARLQHTAGNAHQGAAQPQGLGQKIITQLALQFNAQPQIAKSKAGGMRITLPLHGNQPRRDRQYTPLPQAVAQKTPPARAVKQRQIAAKTKKAA